MTRPRRPPIDEAHVFVTTDRDVIAVVERFAEAWPRWIGRRAAVLRKIAPPVPAGSTVKRRTSLYRGRFNEHFAGFEAIGDETWNRSCVPVGWKLERQSYHRFLTPKLSTPEGKAVQAKITEINKKRPTPFERDLPGMPHERFGIPGSPGSGMMMTVRPGFAWDEAHTVLYVEWSPEAAPVPGVDPTIWKPVWLSKYTAEHELGTITTVRI